MCLFAKNAFLEWKRIEKKRKGRSFRKEETMFLSFFWKIVRRRIVKHKFFFEKNIFCQLEEQQQGE